MNCNSQSDDKEADKSVKVPSTLHITESLEIPFVSDIISNGVTPSLKSC